jgi:hypothetical protein
MNVNTASIIALCLAVLFMQVLDVKKWDRQRDLNSSLVDVDSKIIGILHQHLVPGGAAQ